MSITDEVVKLRRSGKSVEFIKAQFGFKSNGTVFYHLNKAKLRAVYLTEPEIVVLRRFLLDKDGTSEFSTEALININNALKLAEVK